MSNGRSTQKGRFVPTAGGVKLAQAAKDGQRDTRHITLRYTITIEHSSQKTIHLHKRNNRLSNRMTYLPIITLAPSPIPS